MKGIYNPKKLTTDRERFHKIRVLNIGAGAVGSAAVEHEAKLCLSLDVIDDDRFEPDNAAKRSCLVRTPEDDGSNKALCLGRRVQPLLDDGCTANGIDANLRLLGPEALADYDVIVCAVDNNAAKVLLNELVRRLRAIEGIRELAMTTNGARLAEYAERLKSAGLDRLNVSLDTLDPEKYRKITRIGSLSDTLAGLDAARSAGFTHIKLNAVLMGGVNDDEIPALAELARDGAFDVRFIELMPIGQGKEKHTLKEADIIKMLSETKQEYDKIATALNDVRRKGYGVVTPVFEEITLEKPEVFKQGSRYGIKLRAKGESIHLIKADVETEVSPIIGNEEQSREFIDRLIADYESEPEKIWDLNIFGRTLSSMVSDGMQNKIYRMPEDAQMKLQETLQKIVNEGSGGLICIIL